MKTTLREYFFYIDKPEDKAAYEALVEKLKGQGLECFETWGGGSHYHGKEFDGVTVELETKHLFNNQWNAAPIEGDDKAPTGRRLFDWAQDFLGGECMNRNLKRGHYLEQTPEMGEARRNRMACGYCGHQEEAQRGTVFCPHCIDSEYLEAQDLHLTRMQSVMNKCNRKPLAEAERAHLMPLYVAAQLHGSTARGKARITKERDDLVADCSEKIRKATTRRDGFLWLLDHGLKIDNVIYYDHIDKFSFGWRHPVDEQVKNAILEVISEFPFEYEIKTANGVLG